MLKHLENIYDLIIRLLNIIVQLHQWAGSKSPLIGNKWPLVSFLLLIEAFAVSRGVGSGGGFFFLEYICDIVFGLW